MKNYTTLEQSQELVKLIPVSTSDYCYSNASIRGVNYCDTFEICMQTVELVANVYDKVFKNWRTWWQLIPAWSLGKLLSMLPSFVEEEELYITRLNNGEWIVSYGMNLTKRDEELINACHDMLIALINNKIMVFNG